MDRIMNSPSASPPPNVPQLAEVSKKPLSITKALDLHKNKPQCASCHAKIDPIGFGLENFDTVGRFRTKEQVHRTQHPLNLKGQFPDRTKFKDLNEFKSKMMKYKDNMTESLVRGVLSYGLGRPVEFSDRKNIDKLVQKIKSKNYQARELIYSLVENELFLKK